MNSPELINFKSFDKRQKTRSFAGWLVMFKLIDAAGHEMPCISMPDIFFKPRADVLFEMQ
ncbi:hypothetical protein MIZ03_3791 [Rhodoferax lithotrophicus]|uniref:Uncharacterized protein n=1 Tax=Rhodoferax lithotrophicus TaxID=2798804 RepID=A0ABN6DDI5_9BURK|nr:hypothetical protein [Rhodoferax sp. MIZ03]BCO28881.1 hypothetical protein MIZ03_3791 [Rhodoferax sp. MIZ03]